MLTWDFVAEHLAHDHSYWITTVRPDGKPGVRPTWGVWVDGTFHCGGGEGTRRVRNLGGNPDVVVHLANASGPAPPSATAVAWVATLQWLFVGLAFWVDRHRVIGRGGAFGSGESTGP